MVWSGDDNTSIFNELVIHGQRISAAGVELGINDFRISDIGRLPYAKDDLRPAVAYNAAANEHLVVWQGTTVDHEREIIGQRLGLATPFLVVAADEGGGPHVRVLDASTLAEKFSFFAYDAAFRGGVRVATGRFGWRWPGRSDHRRGTRRRTPCPRLERCGPHRSDGLLCFRSGLHRRRVGGGRSGSHERRGVTASQSCDGGAACRHGSTRSMGADSSGSAPALGGCRLIG